MSDIVDTTEMYIKVIYELMEDDVVAMRARIVERLNHSGPTVSQTVARLERDGLLYVDVDRHLKLTDEGMDLATRIMAKHRYAERLLVDKLGFPWELAHDEACKWEHVIGDEVLVYLKDFLGDANTDPYGNAIPVLGEVIKQGKSLIYVADSNIQKVKIKRIGEPVQVDNAVMKQFRENNIFPNSEVYLRLEGKNFLISANEDFSTNSTVILDKNLARHIFVE